MRANDRPVLWYRARLSRSAGGRAQLSAQARLAGRSEAARAGQAFELARDVAAGRYGSNARDVQTTVYWLIGIWLVINALAFGLLFWADEVNRP